MEKFAEWRDSILSDPVDLDSVLARVSCGPTLSSFCRTFLNAVMEDDASAMDDLIVSREKQIKDTRAKLRKPEEYRYDPGHPVHLYQLNYRFDRAGVIVRDILKGLEAGQNV